MAKVYDNIPELIGHTSPVEFHAVERHFQTVGRIIGKPEFMNPSLRKEL